MSKGDTRQFGPPLSEGSTANPQLKPIDLGMPRPWRIGLRLLELQVQLFCDLTDSILIGRAHRESGFVPDIDLGAYGGGEKGVSREHVRITLDGDRLIIIDTGSSNGTELNGERLEAAQPYPLRHGDELTLGKLKLQVELLSDPL